MIQNRRKIWLITPEHLPTVLRRCPKCGCKTEFYNSGKFRVNANGRLLDVWLIYRCEKCDTSWNLAVYERLEAERIEEKEYLGFLNNDEKLAAEYGSRRELFSRNKAEMVTRAGEYKVYEADTSHLCERQDWNEFEIRLADGLKIRLDSLIAKQMGVSRSQVKRLCSQGMIRCSDGRMEAGDRVKDGLVLQVKSAGKSMSGERGKEKQKVSGGWNVSEELAEAVSVVG